MIDYFRKRVLRIHPGFVVNGLLCMFVLAPLVGAGVTVFRFPDSVEAPLRLLVLQIHNFPGTFSGMPVSVVNGSAWTIPYEFRCYIVVALLGIFGTYRSLRFGVLLVTLAAMFVSALDVLPRGSGLLYVLFGGPDQTVRLTGVFMVGMIFYLYREQIPLRGAIAGLAAAVLIAAPFVPVATEFAVAMLGGYLIFWFALRFRPLRVSIWANETDLSYGIYLYAWPVQMAIAYFDRSITSWTLSFLALGVSAILAYFSWTFVEKPALGLAHKNRAFIPAAAIASETTSAP